MSWLPLLLRRAPVLRAENAAALESYRALPAADLDTAASAARFVVVDVETTGLDPYRDRLLAIGAVCVDAGLIRLHDTFETTLRQDAVSSHANILVHGIDGTTQTSGPEAADALIAFLQFAGKAPLVGFHADFDRVVIARAMEAGLGMAPDNAWLDLAQLAPALLPHHAAQAQTLDEWTSVFGIGNYRRHNALADALATAQLLQIVLAAPQGKTSNLAELRAAERAQRWLARR